MRTFVLTDVSHDDWVESFSIQGEALGSPAFRGCSVAKRRLHGGRRIARFRPIRSIAVGGHRSITLVGRWYRNKGTDPENNEH